MNPESLTRILGRRINHRVDLYFAPSKIDNYFHDLGILSNEIIESYNEGAELGAKVFFISPKIKAGRSISEKIVLDSRDKAKVISGLYSDNQSSYKNLIHNLGTGKFYEREETVKNNETGYNYSVNIFDKNLNELSEEDMEVNNLISDEWKRQSRRFETILYTFEVNKIIFASIAKVEHFDIGNFTSYSTQNKFGILGILERDILHKNLILINPFWIWHEQIEN